MSFRVVACVAVVAVLPMGAEAASILNCGPRAEILRQLSARFHEAPVAVGLTENGSLFEVLASKQGATWTALVTRTDGSSCLLMSGQDWQTTRPAPMAHLPPLAAR